MNLLFSFDICLFSDAMKILKIVIVMLILITSVGAVCAADAVSDDDAGYDSQKILQTVQEDNILETTQDDVYSEGEASFFDLQMEIVNATDVLQITKDYKFNNESDASNTGIGVVKDNFVIEGNGHTIDGNNQSRIFIVHGTNVTIKNLTFVNANSDIGSAIYVDPDSSLKTDSVIFENNTATRYCGSFSWKDICKIMAQFRASTWVTVNTGDTVLF